jgi:hypothetical protein
MCDSVRIRRVDRDSSTSQGETVKEGSRLMSSLATNLGLLLAGAAMVFTGFLIQFKFHMGHHRRIDAKAVVLGLDHSGWSSAHKISIIAISVLAIVHIVLHWNWYGTVLRKRLLSKNRLAVTLTIVFVLVAITGYVPWLAGLAGASVAVRRGFVEVHDKLSFVLFGCLLLHVTKRAEWFFRSFKKLSSRGETCGRRPL